MPNPHQLEEVEELREMVRILRDENRMLRSIKQTEAAQVCNEASAQPMVMAEI